jgi:Spy/CpxP family protein refolding chaperone
MKNVQTLMITLVVCLALAATAYAGNMRKMGPHDQFYKSRTDRSGYHGCGMMGGACGISLRQLLRLDMTDAQRAEAIAVMETYRSDRMALTEQLVAARAACAETMRLDAAFDEEAIRQSHRAVAAVMEELAVLRGKMTADIQPILTSDQIEALATGAVESKGKAGPSRERMRLYCPMIDQGQEMQDASPAARD